MQIRRTRPGRRAGPGALAVACLLPALLTGGLGCDVCPPGEVRGPDGLCAPPAALDGGAPPPIACWQPTPDADDPPTGARAVVDGPLGTAPCIGLAADPAYYYQPACVRMGDSVSDGVDNDCDGTIDEDQDGEGGYPAPPPILKSSVNSLGGRRYVVRARGARCGQGADCEAAVAEVAYWCSAFGPQLAARIEILPRRPGSCLAGPGAPVCGVDAARRRLIERVGACDAEAHTVTLTYDAAGLRLTRLESTDPREPPRFGAAEFITDLDEALRCVVDAVAEVNTFAEPGDADGDGQPDGCDNCPRHLNADQADRDADRMGDVCDGCPDVQYAGGDPTDGDGDGRPDGCDPDADGDGLADPCPLPQGAGRKVLTRGDEARPPPALSQRIHGAGGDERLWCVADRDDDGVVDPDDNCRAVANADQADADDDGVGDACCGADDPDDDGVGNCHYLPEMLRAQVADQAGAPTEVGPHWDPTLPVPGEATCDDQGRRTCWPAGTWRGELTPADVARDLRPWLGPDLPFVHRLSPTDAAVAACSEVFRARFGVEVDWPEALWRACIVERGGVVRGGEPEPEPEPEAPPPPARPIEFDIDLGNGEGVSVMFGVHGQRVVWWLGGYWRRDEYCEYDPAFLVTRAGVQRHGSIDIFCRSQVVLDGEGRATGGTPGELVEIKWFRTDVENWAMGRVRKFIDQAERLWLLWRSRSAGDPWLRFIYMFGWQPPPIARSILEHDFRWPDPWGVNGPLYEPLREVGPASGISDRLAPEPMLAGRAYWTRFVPTDFAFIDGILDEAPCVVCSERPELCGGGEPRVALNIAGCQFTVDGVECGVDGELVEVRLTEATDVYVNVQVLKRWAGIYQAWCIEGRALGCNARLSRLYDDLKCAGW